VTNENLNSFFSQDELDCLRDKLLSEGTGASSFTPAILDGLVTQANYVINKIQNGRLEYTEKETLLTYINVGLKIIEYKKCLPNHPSFSDGWLIDYQKQIDKLYTYFMGGGVS
jgi:hypothetical protein